MTGGRFVIVRATAKAALPVAMLFGLYVASSGTAGPGGGVAGGAVAAAALMLYGFVFGADAARRAFPVMALRVAAGIGVAAFLALALAGIGRGYAAFDYHALAAPGPGTVRLGAWVAHAATFLIGAAGFGLMFNVLAGRAADIADRD